MDIFEYGNKDAEVVLIQMVDDHDLETIENEGKLIRDYTGADFRLIACRVDDWNNNLSPWEAPAVFGKQGFGGGAKDTLTKVMTFCEDKSKTYYIGGYSLAGCLRCGRLVKRMSFKELPQPLRPSGSLGLRII